MELEKGLCFSCDNKKLILNHCSERIQQIFVLLYTETVLNVNKLQSIIPELQLCPVCHHKLIILEQIYKHIEANQNDEDEDENCGLCKKGDVIFKTPKSYFKDISDDFPVFAVKHNYDICSQCCFYLDCRYHLKKRLFSQYPQLRIVPKLKLKFGSDITSHSTPLVIEKRERFRRHKRSSSQVIESDTEIPPQKTQFFLDLSAIQSFEVLRNNELISKSKNICTDSKLLNQILYVKLSRENLTSDKRHRSSKDIEAQKDLTELQEIPKKNSMTRKKSKKLNTILESEKETLMEKNEYNSKNSASKADIETFESVPISEEDSHETLKISLNMQKKTYFRIKMKKKTLRKNKSEIKHVEKNNTIPDNFKKSLIVNLERRVMVGGTDQPIEKNSENADNMSIEVTKSEEKSQTVIDNSKMENGSTDNSKFEEHCSLRSAEDEDSKTVNRKENISGECEELGEGNGNTVSNSRCDKNKSEINEHETGNSDVEQPGEDEENEKSENIKSVHILSDETIDREKNDNIADKEGLSQISVDEEESSKEKSDDSIEVAALKTKAIIDQEKTDDETDDKELQGNQEQTDEKSDEDEVNGKKEKDSIDESDDEKGTSHKEETDDEKTDDKKINNKNESDNKEEMNNENKSVDEEGSSGEKEIGIGEEDRNNIDMMLSGITAEPSKDAEEADNVATDNSKDVSNTEQDIDIVTGCKRKRSASPDVSNPEKKKKKVTFSEEVLESSE